MEPKLDFEALSYQVAGLSTRAQATFMYQLINRLGPMVLRTVIKYCCRRLDYINETLPDTHPYKEKYLSYGRKDKVHSEPGELPLSERNFPGIYGMGAGAEDAPDRY